EDRTPVGVFNFLRVAVLDALRDEMLVGLDQAELEQIIVVAKVFGRRRFSALVPLPALQDGLDRGVAQCADRLPAQHTPPLIFTGSGFGFPALAITAPTRSTAARCGSSNRCA